ncbi:MAG: hypothetical protein V4671_03595 [Armatimonadota bacterium]
MLTLIDQNQVAFRLISASEFSYKHLEEYPVWSEFYDYDEREEILGWGIDETWFDQEFTKHHDGSDHAMYPLLEVNPFPTRERIYVSARFHTPAGQSLLGYVILKIDAAPVLYIFHDGQEFGFSTVFPNQANKDREKLQRLLTDPKDPIFPLMYETEFTDKERRTIEGIFDIGTA